MKSTSRKRGILMREEERFSNLSQKDKIIIIK
jgi:hypothetical protein